MNKNLSVAAILAGSLAFPAVAQVDAEAPKPVEAEVKVTLPTIDNSSPKSTVESLKAAIEKGECGAIWSAIAPAHRAEIQRLAQDVASKVDPAVYDMFVGFATKTSKLLESNAKFIANTPMIKMMSDPTKTAEDMVAELETTASMLSTLAKSQFGSHADFAKVNLDKFFATDGAKVLLGVTKVADVKLGEITEADGKATVTVHTDKDEESIPLHSVQGKWYFDIGEQLEEVAAEVGEMKKMTKRDAMQMQGMAQAFEPIFKQFEGVETQEDFDATIQEVMGPLMRMFGGGMGGGMGGGQPGGGFGR